MSAAPISVLQKNPALAWREIDEETVIISPADNIMHELNDTGSFLWKHIDGKRNASELASLLAATYEVAEQTALEDTKALLNELFERKLVVPAEAGTGDATR